MLKKGLAIIIGSTFIALGINSFVIPNHLLDGGIIGIGLLAKYLFEVKVGLTIILLSTPLYVIAYFYKRRYFYNGVHGLLVSSFFIDLFHPLSEWYLDDIPILIGTVIAGILIGLGIGIMLGNDISTGGLDLLALMLANITSINAGVYILIMDCLILLIGSFVIPEVTIFYSACMVLMIGFTTSLIINRFSKYKKSS
ncbi:YitT family protein [Oceanobacillus senegalensis]|uniref:YitT family protein n=1 Tax=Oceanobacillus senegalensis TaxID=1936063 RepID=UPI000A311603|nr:YitT family protein [Oceanobacillus senegalensis]